MAQKNLSRPQSYRWILSMDDKERLTLIENNGFECYKHASHGLNDWRSLVHITREKTNVSPEDQVITVLLKITRSKINLRKWNMHRWIIHKIKKWIGWISISCQLSLCDILVPKYGSGTLFQLKSRGFLHLFIKKNSDVLQQYAHSLSYNSCLQQKQALKFNSLG